MTTGDESLVAPGLAIATGFSEHRVSPSKKENGKPLSFVFKPF